MQIYIVAKLDVWILRSSISITSIIITIDKVDITYGNHF